MPWLDRTQSDPAIIAVAVPDDEIVGVDLLIDEINNAKPATDERRGEDIIFAIGCRAMSRYTADQIRNLFEDSPQ